MWGLERDGHDYTGVAEEGACLLRVRQWLVRFVLHDSLKLYSAQVKAGTDVREGQRVNV